MAYEFLFGIILIVVFAVFIFVVRKLGKVKTTYLAQPQQFNPQVDVTTVLPIPIHAATCDHDWETIVDQNLEMPHEKKIVLVMACRRCGIIDKTVQITSSPPPPSPPPPCLHDWQTVVEQKLDVAHEKKVVIILTCRRCGQIDKTTEVTSKPPPVPAKEWSKSECRHKWETEKKVTLDSAYEQMLKSVSVNKPSGKKQIEGNIDLDLNTAPAWMFVKRYVCVRVCNTCGEIDKIVASNFELVDSAETQEWPESK
jgi:hypothetical protein